MVIEMRKGSGVRQQLSGFNRPWFVITRLLVAIILLAMLLTACDPTSTNPDSLVDQSTPEATVHSLYEAYSSQDDVAFRMLLDPDDPDRSELVRAFKRMEAEGIRYEATEIQIDIVEEQPDMVRLRAHYRGKIIANGSIMGDEQTGEELSLIKKNGRWYLLGYGQWPPPGWVLERTPVPYATPTVPGPKG